MPSDLLLNGGRAIGDSHPTFVIAEVGQNHQGDMGIAKQLIRKAKECGADCVKFQKTCLEEKFTEAALSRPYDSRNSWGNTYREHKQHLEFSEQQFLELQAFARENDILFSASAMDSVSLDFLAGMDLPFVKIGSGDANNLVLLREAAQREVPLVISTGMQDLKKVQKVYEHVGQYTKKFALLHCLSAYPAPIEHVNLKVISLYKQSFPDIQVGYSGHERGIHVSLAAVALGAKIIERHITLDRTQKGSDHCCSLEPQEFRALVAHVRSLETALGHPVKALQPSERACHDKLGKSVVAAKFLRKGTILLMNDLKVKVSQPKGIDPINVYNIIWRVLKVDLAEGEPVTNECLE